MVEPSLSLFFGTDAPSSQHRNNKTLFISPRVDMSSGIFWFTVAFSLHDSLLWITALSMMGYNAER
jgi:hypothetical protein